VTTLFYEIIDLPLPEYENLMSFKVAYHNERLEEVSQHSVRIHRAAAISELLEQLRGQLPPEAAGDAPLRLLEVYQWKIWQVRWAHAVATLWSHCNDAAIMLHQLPAWWQTLHKAGSMRSNGQPSERAPEGHGPAFLLSDPPLVSARASTAPPRLQLFNPRDRVESIGDNAWHLRVEAVPEDQRDLEAPGALHVHCLQVTEEPNNVSVQPSLT
jgi:hypothetical protein